MFSIETATDWSDYKNQKQSFTNDWDMEIFPMYGCTRKT